VKESVSIEWMKYILWISLWDDTGTQVSM